MFLRKIFIGRFINYYVILLMLEEMFIKILEQEHLQIFKLVLKKYLDKKISLGRAAELARMPLVEFMKIIAERAIALNYSVKSLEEDFERALR